MRKDSLRKLIRSGNEPSLARIQNSSKVMARKLGSNVKRAGHLRICSLFLGLAKLRKRGFVLCAASVRRRSGPELIGEKTKSSWDPDRYSQLIVFVPVHCTLEVSRYHRRSAIRPRRTAACLLVGEREQLDQLCKPRQEITDLFHCRS